MRKRTVALLAVFLMFASTGAVRALEETISLGGDYPWGQGSTLQGLVTTSTRTGGNDLGIRPFRYEPDEQTEILLHFDSLPLSDVTGAFTIHSAAAELSRVTRRSGEAALLVDSAEDEVVARPVDSVYFRSGVEWGSFLIEFWLYPVTLSDGERLLHWGGREGPDLDFRVQRVLAEIRSRKVQFTFDNLFSPPNRAPFVVQLEGDTGLIPRRWSHHKVMFDADTGRLEYQVDGVVADVAFASSSGHEDGTVFFPRTARYPDAELSLFSSFTGVVDEFRILRRSTSSPAPGTGHQTMAPGGPPLWYDLGGGSFESEVIDLGSPGARLVGISLNADTPGLSDVSAYIKVADFTNGSGGLPGEWIPVLLDERFEPLVGRFAQVRAELLPDPSLEASPVLSGVSLTYVPDPPPNPPMIISAVPGDGQVELSWSPVLEPDIQGYLVYYGEQPGRYFSAAAEAGPSPLDVGPVTAMTITGLENGTLYYFSVGAYDISGQPAELSPEAAARPARVYQ